jgi:hypothetical protein
MAANDKLGFANLTELARTSAGIAGACPCAIDTYREWTRIPASFPQEQMRTLGTLVDDPYTEATYAEYHPDGTSYWSPDAPIAPHYFPYNRCTVQECSVCGRHCLTYTEAGGYYVEPRLRALVAALLVDPPLVDAPPAGGYIETT